ncbi:MAG: FAD-binding oxidoreductase [Crocinitomicaceae bacterium]|nr:FAD-binding oxidoreductase [Crocinitomicaceae bacterium]
MSQASSNISFWEHQTFINHSNFVVIGSGIVGLSTAIHIKQRNPGKKVTVLEQGILPTGASTKNAGFACVGSPSELISDLKNASEEDVFKTVKKRYEGLLLLRRLLGDDNIDYLSLGSFELFDEESVDVYEVCMGKLAVLNDSFSKYLAKENVFYEDHEIVQRNGFQGFNKAIAHRLEGQIDTGRMMKNLLHLAREKGVEILNGIKVNAIHSKSLETNLGVVNFDKCTVCTNGFSKQFFPNEDVEPARAQVLITKPIEELKIKGIYHFDEGYFYFRNIGNRILFGGGRNLDFEGENTDKIEITDQIVGHLKGVLKEKILPNNAFEIERTWAGIMGVGNVKSPIIKQVEENIYCAIRLGGMGVAIGSLVGQELADIIDKS